MLQINSEGHVIVTHESNSYDLSDSTQYRNFLLWITTPEDEVKDPGEKESQARSVPVINPDCDFAIDENAAETDLAILERYRIFLKSFAKKRTEIIANGNESMRGDKRLKEIQDLTARLKRESNSEASSR